LEKTWKRKTVDPVGEAGGKGGNFFIRRLGKKGSKKKKSGGKNWRLEKGG